MSHSLDKPAPGFVIRMEIELGQLHERTIAIRDFMTTDEMYYLMDDTEQDLMEDQYLAMVKYRKVLRERLAIAKERDDG